MPDVVYKNNVLMKCGLDCRELGRIKSSRPTGAVRVRFVPDVCKARVR